jgi:hypothetical protein
MKSTSNANDHVDVLGRRYAQIDLTQPFEHILATALALPDGRLPVLDKQIINAARAVYEMVHGRSVNTTVGLISIAPPVCPWAVVRHLKARSREDFLTAAERWLARAATERGVIAGAEFAERQSPPNDSDHEVSLLPASRESWLNGKDQMQNSESKNRSTGHRKLERPYQCEARESL